MSATRDADARVPGVWRANITTDARLLLVALMALSRRQREGRVPRAAQLAGFGERRARNLAVELRAAGLIDMAAVPTDAATQAATA